MQNLFNYFSWPGDDIVLPTYEVVEMKAVKPAKTNKEKKEAEGEVKVSNGNKPSAIALQKHQSKNVNHEVKKREKFSPIKNPRMRVVKKPRPRTSTPNESTTAGPSRRNIVKDRQPAFKPAVASMVPEQRSKSVAKKRKACEAPAKPPPQQASTKI